MIPVKMNNSSDYEPVPAGNHVGRVYSIIHIGTLHEDTAWGPKNRNKVRITFELPNETKVFKDGDGEKPYSISSTYTLNFGDKANLRKMVEGMYGRQLFDEEAAAFDVESLMGATALVNVTHTTKGDKTYANIAAVTPVPKGMTVPPAVNTPTLLNYTNFDERVFAALPDFVKKQIEESDEYRTMPTSLTAHRSRSPCRGGRTPVHWPASAISSGSNP